MNRSRKVGTTKTKLRFTPRIYLLVSLAIILTLASASRRTVIMAATCVTDPVVANNADSGAGSLRQAILDACDGSTITFASTVLSPITLTSDQLLIQGKSLTIQGPGTRPMTISGNHANRVIETKDLGLAIQVTLSNLTIANGATGQDPSAAGVFSNGTHGTVNIINCTVSGNGNVGGPNGGQGGGIENSGTMNIINSTISGNSATQQDNGGGGIFNNGTLNLTNCTISGNSTNSSGGGIRNNSGTVNIENTIVAGNTASQSGPDVFNSFNSQGHNLIGKSDGSTGFTDGVNNDQVGSIAMPLDPGLGPLQDNGGPTFTMALLANSPAIDKGDDSVLGTPLFLTTDQRGPGFHRKSGSHVDIGAFEVQQPCVLTCPANITKSNDTDQCGAQVSYPAPTTSSDIDCDTVTCSPASGSFFPVGTTTVTCTSNNGDGPGMCMFTVTVQDTQNPMITCPANISTSTDPDQCSAKVTYAQPPVSDNCPQVGTPTCSPASGTTFQKGTTTVTCSVKDSSNNMSMCSFTVTVNDAQPPKITCPATITKPNDPDQCGAVVTYPAPMVSDNCPGVGTPTCSPPSGSFFPVGTTTVTCSVKDAASNMSSCSFTITVQDTQNPTITCPANITAVAGASCTIATGASVSFTVTASDNCPGVMTSCNPPSGSTFPVGTTTVTCKATDASGNMATCTFSVTASSFCLQDETNPGNVALVNAQTGDFTFCCGGVPIASGRGTLTAKGCIGSIDANKGDRQVHIQWDTSANNGAGEGTAYVMKRSTRVVCQITDKNMSNNTCQCSSPPPVANPKKPPKERAS